MTTPFAEFESELNAAVMEHLPNATAVIGANSVDGVFSRTYVEQFGVEGMKSSFRARNAQLIGVAHGTVISVSSVSYRVIAMDEDSGITTLVLEKS